MPRVIWGKRKKRSQICEIFTEDGRIETMEFDVLRGCVDDPILGIGFILDADDQYVGEDKYWHQILGERSMLPIRMLNPKGVDEDEEALNKIIDQIFEASCEAAKLAQYTKAANKNKSDNLVKMFTVGMACFLIIFAMVYYGGG